MTAFAAEFDAPATPAAPKPDGGAASPASRLDDLAEIISAYNAVTEKLQHSHATLQNEVLRLRRELTSANAQLLRSKRLSALGEMAAGIAHEIRNPLAAIQLYAGMALEDLDAGQGDHAADNTRKIVHAVQGMGSIVNDVLAFAREVEPRHRTVLAGDLFARVLDAHRPALVANRVQFHLDGQLAEVYADPDLLHQALLNLVRNAVDAMITQASPPLRSCSADHDGGTRDAALTLCAASDEAGVTLAVTDTGPGIQPDAVDRIFNPFFTTRSSGTGLGLAIVHRIADAHRGAITVHNHPEHGGAVFTLHLPKPPKAAPPQQSGDHP